MKTKLIFIMLMILMALSISGVCASDIDNTTIDVADDQIEQNIAIGDDPGTFSELQDLIDKNTVINLTKDYVMQTNKSIAISKDITINGNGHTINGNKKGSIFEISGGNIALNNLILINGKAPVNGGAINVQSAAGLKFDHVTFSNNFGDDYGGAVYIKAKTPATFTDCNFKSNEADDHNGGAIYSNGPITCTNCNFTGNHADNYGGAIDAESSLTCTNCNFENSKATDYYGGSLYVNGALNATNCNFTQSQAYGGGSIYVESDETSIITNCNFKNSKSTSVYGGAIHSRSNLTVINSTFKDNTAFSDGGAISTIKPLYLINCLFENNEALNYRGGAVRAIDMVIFNSTFTNNRAKYTGAIRAVTVNATKATFNKNGGVTGKFEDYSYGGAIEAEVVNLDSCEFNENYINREGGAIYLKGPGQSTIKNSTFNGNYAKGAVLLCFGGAVKANDLLIVESSNFTNNYAEDRGGAIYSCEDLKFIGNSNLIGNEANDYGGAVYSEKNTYINWNDNGKTTFKSNTAKTDQGGAIRGKNIYMKNTNFTANYGDDYGGAIYSDGQVTAESVTFNNNYAGHQGGAMYTNELTLRGYSNFTGNEAKDSGGAIYTNTFKEDITYAIFINNKAGDDGGAVYINKENNPKIESCYFENNTCKSRGGAIYIDDSDSKVSLIHNIFVNNKAGSKGQTAYACGDFKTVEENWHGTNDPDYKDQFKEGVAILPDHDYKVTNYLNIKLTINDTCPYLGNPSELTVYFVKKDGTKATEMYNYDAAFSTTCGIITNKKISDTDYNKVTADVTFTEVSYPTVKATMNQQTLALGDILVIAKLPSSVTILEYKNITYPGNETIRFAIENRSSPFYTLKNSKGEIISNGSIGDADSLTFSALEPEHYTITIENPETWDHMSSSASADFLVMTTAKVEVSANNVTYPTPTTIELTSNIDGTYLVSVIKLRTTWKIDKLAIEVTNGKGRGEISLEPASYTTNTTSQFDQYIIESSEAKFKVEGQDSEFELNVDDIFYTEYITGEIIIKTPGTYYLSVGDYAEMFTFTVATTQTFTKGPFEPGPYIVLLRAIIPGQDPTPITKEVTVAGKTNNQNKNPNKNSSINMDTPARSIKFAKTNSYAKSMQTYSHSKNKGYVKFIAENKVVSQKEFTKGYKYKVILKSKDDKPLANKKVNMILNGITLTGYTDENGTVYFNLTGNFTGIFNMTLIFEGDEYYNPQTETRTIEIR